MHQALQKIGTSTFSSLRNTNFRLYFIAQAISITGMWMQNIGQAWLVLELTGSGTALGLVTALQYLPILVFGPFAGVIVDRYPKRKLLFLTQILSAILALILGILVLTHQITLPLVYVLALLLGFVNAVDNPIRQTFVYEMVGPSEITNAVTLNTMESSLGRVVGPAISGLLIVSIGIAPCFLFNAFSFLAVIGMLLVMDTKKLNRLPTIQRSSGQLMEGFRYVASSRMLKHTLIIVAIIGTLTYEFSINLALFGEYTFHEGVRGYTMLSVAFGLGATIGGLFSAHRKRISTSMFTVTTFLFGIAVLATAVSPVLPIALVGMMVVGVFSVNVISMATILLQLESKPEMRGRVMALLTVAFLGSTPIGGPIIGWIGEHIGARYSMGVSGAAAVIAALYGYVVLEKNYSPMVTPAIELAAQELPQEKEDRPI
jgi:MFS family permease